MDEVTVDVLQLVGSRSDLQAGHSRWWGPCVGKQRIRTVPVVMGFESRCDGAVDRYRCLVDTELRHGHPSPFPSLRCSYGGHSKNFQRGCLRYDSDTLGAQIVSNVAKSPEDAFSRWNWVCMINGVKQCLSACCGNREHHHCSTRRELLRLYTEMERRKACEQEFEMRNVANLVRHPQAMIEMIKYSI
jgi:hypothetical protein